MSVTSQGLNDQEQLRLEQIRSKFRSAGKEEALDKVLSNIARNAVSGNNTVKTAIANAVRTLVIEAKKGQGIDPSDF